MLSFNARSAPRLPHVVALPPEVAQQTLDGAVTGEELLPLEILEVTVEVHITVANVTLKATFVNPTETSRDCMYQVSLSEGKALIISASVEHSGQLIETAVVEADLAEAATGEKGGEDPALAGVSSRFSGGSVGAYNPDVFRLPFAALPGGSRATVTVTYLQDLEFCGGEYGIRVPTEMPPEMLQEMESRGVQLSSAIPLRTVINTGTSNCEWGNSTHRMLVMESSPARVVLESDPNTPDMPNADFNVSYRALEPDIRGQCIVQAPSANKEGSFCLYLSPPEDVPANKVFGRDIVFLLDRSGSMTGVPMTSAVESLITALEELRDLDRFAICALDHEQEWFHPAAKGAANDLSTSPTPQGLTRVSGTSIDQAIGWVSTITARGGTDIYTPYQQAVKMLSLPSGGGASLDQDDMVDSGLPRLPLTVIVTDGAVANEREICRFARDKAQSVRTFTLGIGIFVNRYFLKMLAQIGRGYSALSLYTPNIGKDITSLMAKTHTPVLTDISLGIPGLPESGCEIYPYPFPDLYQQAPLVLAGRFEGQFPPDVWVKATVPSGEVVQFQVPASHRGNVPVNKVYDRMRLDFLVAKWWLADSKEQEGLKKEVVQASVQSSMPCPFTTTVAYKVKDDDKAKTKEERQEQFQDDVKRKKGGMSGVAVGGIIVLGTAAAAALAFGSTTGTLSNLGAADAMSSLFENGFEGEFFSFIGGAFEDVGEATCSCCQAIFGICGFDQCGEALDGCCAGHENALDSVFGSCGSCCEGFMGSIGGLFGGCISNVEACTSGCWACTSDGFQSCLAGDILGGCGGCLSNGAGECWGCFTGCLTPLTDCTADVVGNVGDCCGSCASSYGAFLTSCNCEEALGDACGSIGGAVSGMGECLGECLGELGPCIEGVLNAVGDVIGALGD